MRIDRKLFKAVMLAVSIGGFVAQAIITTPALAQSNNPLVWEPPPAKIKRVKKVDRKPKRVIRTGTVEKATLLTLQYQVYKRGDGNVKEEVDPQTVFQEGDQVKFAVATNQDGYLYIINQPEGKDGVVLFPSPQINQGQNKVKKNELFLIPSYCKEVEGLQKPEDCWFEMRPPAGRERIIIIFSRDEITTLPNQVAKAYGAVKGEIIAGLIKSSGQNKVQETGELRIPGLSETMMFATRVQNTNLKDNEELIATFDINHGE